MQTVIVDHDFSLPPERIYAYLAEHENLEPVFGAKITRKQDGTDGTRNGVGSVRVLKIGPLPAFEETVTETTPNELVRYRITKGSPLRDHEGVMRFSPTASGGTHLHYEISFRGVAPGLDVFVAAMLRRSIPKGLARVDAAA
jgi:uncharacterized protein YndB with AHSA1/START domain